MPWILLIIFIIIPAIEIGLFVWIGSYIGAGWVIAIIILTGVLGAALARQQGMETWRRAQLSLASRRVPGEEIIDGICIFIGGIFLLSPGFVTDVLGFFLMVPFTRRPLKLVIKKWLGFLAAKKTIFFKKW